MEQAIYCEWEMPEGGMYAGNDMFDGMQKVKDGMNKMGCRGMMWAKKMKECMCNRCEDADACDGPAASEEGSDCEANRLVQMAAEKKGAKKVKKALKKLLKAIKKRDKFVKKGKQSKADKAMAKFVEDGTFAEYEEYQVCTGEGEEEM